MINGKEKAMILLSLLNSNQANIILKKLPKEAALALSSNIGNTPNYDSVILKELLDELFTKTKKLEKNQPQPKKVPEEMSLKTNTEEKEDKTELILKKLETQKPQIIAFLLEKMEDKNLKEQLLAKMKKELKEKVTQIKVEDTPLSEKIYQNIAKNIFD
jgi:flagellar motor switch protein FliG